MCLLAQECENISGKLTGREQPECHGKGGSSHCVFNVMEWERPGDVQGLAGEVEADLNSQGRPDQDASRAGLPEV
jgi:hypothetical protein